MWILLDEKNPPVKLSAGSLKSGSLARYCLVQLNDAVQPNQCYSQMIWRLYSLSKFLAARLLPNSWAG
ncbi:MAG: hypothetical protein OFPII_33930 [Osedax symbiont Rs1]|nr:MAG: hypothetical protein OFPII_33930 [Osedax symbiont Rs1]